ncbi:hypothetical protein SAMN05216382_3162 [Sphingomonas palmae]|uniref:Uncharacterized protein n=1 Tax=Sphingomonas palmae TaxID=1855283 RepID=A0A1H7V5Q3_9SPHN|nr:hypothetical protein SAMN05216382_3162 [Sphingomonas palmae]
MPMAELVGRGDLTLSKRKKETAEARLDSRLISSFYFDKCDRR